MRSRVRWRVATLSILASSALLTVPSSRAQHGRLSGTANSAASRAMASVPQTQFAKAFVGPWAGAGQIRYEAMALDGQGNIVVAGAFSGQIDFGGGSIFSHGGVDIFIAKYSASGAYLWSQAIGAGRDDWAKAVALDLSGNIFITSFSSSGTVDFGGGPISLVSGYLAKYDPNGAYLWAKALGTSIADGTALDIDSYGNVIVSGYFTGACDFGGGPVYSVQNGDAFLAKYSPAGGYMWALRAGGSAAYGTQVGQVTVDHSDQIVVTGWTTGAGDMGGVSFPGLGGNDVFLAKYSATGSPLWSKSLGGANQDRGKGVAIDSLNNIVMTGLIGDNANLGAGALMGGGIFLSKYSPAGIPLWSENFPPPSGWPVPLDNGNGVAIDSSDRIAITGAVLGDINFGGGVLPMATGDNNDNTYVAEYTSAGANLWSTRFPNLVPVNSPGYNSGKAVGTDSSGNVIAFGEFSDSINLGNGVLTNPGACGGACGYGAYLAKFGTSSSSTPTPTAPPATPTPTQTPTSVVTSTYTPTNTPTPTPTNTPTPTRTPTNTPTPTRTPTPTNTPKGAPTNTPTPTPTSTPTPASKTSLFLPNGSQANVATPCRLLDTRDPIGPSGGPPLSPGSPRTFPVAGLCGVPSTAQSVAIVIAVVSSGDGGDIRLYPTGSPAPVASAINFKAGAIRANNGVFPLGTGGQITALLDEPPSSTATVNLIIDVYGYFQ